MRVSDYYSWTDSAAGFYMPFLLRQQQVKMPHSADQEYYFNKLRSMHLKNPVLIGFGIRDKSAFTQACSYATVLLLELHLLTFWKIRAKKKSDPGYYDFINSLK